MVRVVAAAVVLVGSLLLAACGGDSGDGEDAAGGDKGDTDVPTTPIVFQTVEKGAQGPSEESTVVARSQAEFEEAWRSAGGDEPPKLSGVDFGTEMVIAVFQGQQPTAGYDIEITEVGATYEVTYVASRPADDCITAQVLTAPFHVVTVPASAKRPVFEATERVNPC